MKNYHNKHEMSEFCIIERNTSHRENKWLNLTMNFGENFKILKNSGGSFGNCEHFGKIQNFIIWRLPRAEIRL